VATVAIYLNIDTNTTAITLGTNTTAIMQSHSASPGRYLDDALGERVWTSMDENRLFVQNIETVFGTYLLDSWANFN
jgi:hypothetical protein